FQYRRCWWDHLLGYSPSFRAHIGQGREFEGLGNVDRLVGRRHLGGESVPEAVVELPRIGHSDPQATSGLERVVLGTERLDVAESCQSALEGIEVEERDDVIHFRLLRCPRATRCRAAVPLLDQRLAQVLRDRVARGLRIEWGAGGRI